MTLLTSDSEKELFGAFRKTQGYPWDSHYQFLIKKKTTLKKGDKNYGIFTLQQRTGPPKKNNETLQHVPFLGFQALGACRAEFWLICPSVAMSM